jgi:hypothetical protein
MNAPVMAPAGARVDVHVCPIDQLEDKIARLLGWKIEPITMRD